MGPWGFAVCWARRMPVESQSAIKAYPSSRQKIRKLNVIHYLSKLELFHLSIDCLKATTGFAEYDTELPPRTSRRILAMPAAA